MAGASRLAYALSPDCNSDPPTAFNGLSGVTAGPRPRFR